MGESWLARTELLLGPEALEQLKNARVAVLGLGGVGGAAAEALCRAGIGHMLLIDHDKIDPTNLNRQILATQQTIGMDKTQSALERLFSICPNGDFSGESRFYFPEDCAFLYDWQPDFIIDAIDTVTAKLHLFEQCQQSQIPLLTCLGTGNRFDPSFLRIGDLADTAKGCGCGLARVMRRELRRKGFLHGQVLYSLEPPKKAVASQTNGRHAPGSISFVPPAAGLLLAAEAVKFLLDKSPGIRYNL